MIINLSDKELKELDAFLNVKECNISAAEFYIDYLENYYDEISKFDIDNLSKKYSIEQSFFKAMLNKMDTSEKDQEIKDLITNSNIDKVSLLNADEFLNDDYAKCVGFPIAKSSEWELRTLKYLQFEGFVSDELEINNEYYQERTPFGFFDKEVPYLAVIQNDSIWMSVIPHEINTMKKPIQNAYGNVLVLGLGLGYYAFHISNKDDVDSITIIENDKKVIELFNNHILPKFSHKEKIKVIYEDAFAHLKEFHDYDYAFIDIWHNVGDGLPLYLKIKQYEKDYPNTRFDYWIETSLIAMLRRQTLTVIEEQLYDGLKEEDYLKATNENDAIINAIYFATKDYKIDSIDDIRKLLSDENLKSLASKLKIKGRA